MQQRQLLKAAAFTGVGVAVIAVIYLIAGAMSSAVAFGLLLGFVAATIGDFMLMLAAKNGKSWQIYYIGRVAVMVVCVVASVLLSGFISPVATVFALIVSLPAVALSVMR